MTPAPSPDLPPAAVAALREGRKIEAIKIVRNANGLQLKDAKEAVDAYLEAQPALQAEYQARQKEAQGTFEKWLLIVAVMIAVAYFLGTSK
jgi:hypothetical protein